MRKIAAIALSLALLGATPTPAPSAASAGTSDLTPEQQAAVQAYIVKASQNPVGNIAAIPVQFNNNYALGPYARYQFNINVQPVIPFMLSPHMNLVARTIIPVLVTPSNLPPALCPPSGVCGSTFGISDIQEQLFFAPKTKPGALIWGAGPIFQFPTASPQVLGTGQWSAGPAVVGLITPGTWVIGILATQLWSVTGRTGAAPVDAGLLQPFINYNLKNNWSLTTAPVLNANYTAPGNQKWSIPLGGGVSKTFKLGDQLMQLGVFYYTYVERPISTPQTQFRINWALLFPIKRGFDLQEILRESGVKP